MSGGAGCVDYAVPAPTVMPPPPVGGSNATNTIYPLARKSFVHPRCTFFGESQDIKLFIRLVTESHVE